MSHHRAKSDEEEFIERQSQALDDSYSINRQLEEEFQRERMRVGLLQFAIKKALQYETTILVEPIIGILRDALKESE